MEIDTALDGGDGVDVDRAGGMSSYAAMRARCAVLLRELGVRPPVPLAELVDAVGVRAGRRISLAPAVLDSGELGLFGMTGPGPGGAAREDLISYQARTTAAHQLVIILHELAHLLADHPRRSADIRPDDVRSRLVDLPDSILHLVLGAPAPAPAEPDSPVEVPVRAVALTLYDSGAEWEAEAMARIMRSWVVGAADRTRIGESGISAVLGDPGRWA